MGKLETILAKQQEAAKLTTKVRIELEEFCQAIMKGEESTGDAVSDFCIAHRLVGDEITEGKLRKLSKSISEAKGEPLLVVTKFGYVYDTVMCHGFGARPEYKEGEMTFLRATVADEPVWTVKGIVIPGKHYAFADGGRFFMEPQWQAHTAPFLLTDAELLNNYYAWKTTEGKANGRTDLPDAFWKAFKEGPDNYKSERAGCKTEIIVGDKATAMFKRWGHRWEGKNDDRKLKRFDSCAEALHCVKHGITVEEKLEQEKGDLYRKQLHIAEGLVQAIETGESDDDIRERLTLGVKVSVQELNTTRRGKQGVKYEFPDFFIGLCKEYGVSYK